MSETKKCPKCGSRNTSTTILGDVETGGAALLAVGAGLLTGIFNQHQAAHAGHAVMHGCPRQYECKNCGHTWHQ